MSRIEEKLEERLERQSDAPQVVATPNGTGGSSVLDIIKRRRVELQAEHEYLVYVPGYDRLLAIKCHPLSSSVVTAARERMEKSKNPERDFGLAADLLISACDEVVARKTRTSPWEPLARDGEPTQLDDRLADMLGWVPDPESPLGPARQLVQSLFDKVPAPEMAVSRAVGEYLMWCQGEDVDVEEELLGEA